MEADVTVIGSGPAGLTAALHAEKSGAKNVLLLEREEELGGILKQCIHNGFGLEQFKKDYTGPEYAERLTGETEKTNVRCFLNTMVTGVAPDRTITAVNPEKGVFHIESKSVVLAMGCRERARGSINIPGTRPAGVYTAGVAQRFVNIDGYLPGKETVILGSGDIGLIMARRLTLEGAQVNLALVEEGLAVTAVTHSVNRTEDDLKALLRHRCQMICTDGVLLGSHPHPRGYGTYPRLLGRYVREWGVLDLEECIRKMTGLPAQLYGFRDRGLLREGFAADIVCFDPERIIDRATYEHGRQAPEGIPYVIVNGKMVIDQGNHTGALPGRALRKAAALPRAFSV